MDPDGNRLQNSCSPRHWGHSTMHRVPPVSGTTTTMCLPKCNVGNTSCCSSADTSNKPILTHVETTVIMPDTCILKLSSEMASCNKTTCKSTYFRLTD